MKALFDHHGGRHFDIDGARIYVEVRGPESAPPLVLLHGGMGTINDFDAVMSLFEKPFRFIGIDSRGHGASTLGAGGLTYERLEKDVTAVVEQLGLRSFSLMGFSDGGIVGLRLAASRSVVIDKLVAIGTHPELPNDDRLREIYANITGESWRKKFPEGYQHYQRVNPQPDFDKLTAAAVKMWQDDSKAGYPAHLLESIEQEVLVIRGDQDHLVSRASTFALVDRLKKAKLLVLPYAGHVVMADESDAMMNAVNRFL